MTVIGLPGVLMIAGLAVGLHNYRSRSGPIAGGQGKLRVSELMTMPDLRKWLIISGTFMSAVTTFPFTVALHAVEIRHFRHKRGPHPRRLFGRDVRCAGASSAGQQLPEAGAGRAISMLLGACAYALISLHRAACHLRGVCRHLWG